jgi:mono/diheme cytochrome c family protein
VAATAEQISRGKYLSQILCSGCHSPDDELPMRGGKNLSDDVGLPLGSLYAANLTPGGDLKNWSDGEILRALRWGAHKSGRALAMPSKATSQLSDADAQAIVAFLRSQPAVQNQLPSTSPSLLLGILLGAGQFDLSVAPDTGPVVAPPRGATVEYGQYVINIADCKACHGDDLAGGKPPAPQGPSLYFVRGLTKEQFLIAMRIGLAANRPQKEDVMPWKTYARMDEVDLAAIYATLHSLPLAQK